MSPWQTRPDDAPTSYQLSQEHLTFAALARIEALLREIRDLGKSLAVAFDHVGSQVDEPLEDPTPDLNDVVAYAIVCKSCG